MNSSATERRHFVTAALAGSGIVLSHAVSSTGFAAEKEKPVTGAEDLMQEHGVLRRALLIYRAAAARLRNDPASVPADALAQTAKLFREFGEDYHEERLEEKMIFPLVRKLKSPAAAYPDILEKQHKRGRELNDYVTSVTRGGAISSANALPLAKALDEFEWMYQHHAAREDTIVFIAWKEALSDKAYKEMSEKFEDIEKQMFGQDGFEEMVKKIGQIETRLDLSDISQFTMPSPPKK